MKSIEEVLKSKRRKMEELAHDINMLEAAIEVMRNDDSWPEDTAGITSSTEPRGIPAGKQWP